MIVKKKKFHGINSSISYWLRQSAGLAANQSRRVSSETMESRSATLFMVADHLKQGGFMLEDIANMKPKHLSYLARRWEMEGKSASTLQNRWSILRVMFEKVIGRKGFVRGIECYLENPGRAKRSYVANVDKSWSARVNSLDLIAKVENYDPYVGGQLRLMKEFGLRRKEAILFQPNVNDLGLYISVVSGTKGGRPRYIEVSKPTQRELLDKIKDRCQSKFQSMGNPKLTLAQNINRFNNVMQKLGITKKDEGVTSHGLRHQFASDLFEELAGAPSPVRAHPCAEQPTLDKQVNQMAREEVTNALGHARTSITNAYIGSNCTSRAASNHPDSEDEEVDGT